MQLTSSIRAVNSSIRDFNRGYKSSHGLSRAENLAYARYSAKFEEPAIHQSSERRSDAWDRWIRFDERLPKAGILGPHWAKARLLIREILSSFRMGPLTFTNGSSFEPLGNRTSIACRLTAVWTITRDCFDLFAELAYSHRALKMATKKRFTNYCKEHGYSERRLNKVLWRRFSKTQNPPLEAFKFKLFCTVKFVNGNRWSTVPKNNLKDRSICLEPLCNMLVQRAIGLGIRSCLKDKIGIDLDSLADVHRHRISDPKIATIDLSDCSDAISVRLINYLLPKRVLAKVLACRSDMTLGLDGNYHVVNKVSSMGNGFTFDLMTLVLLALTRSFDPTSSVFGDDIICQNQYADDIVSNLQIAGFVVNEDKTLIRSSYRESCGAHFIDGYGYVTTFDQRWLHTPHDLIVACNKVAILADIYKGPFESLRAKIWSCVPPALLGATAERQAVDMGRPPNYSLDTYVRYGPIQEYRPSERVCRTVRRAKRYLCKSGFISSAVAIESRRGPTYDILSANDWDLFLQHIHNGRLSRRIPKVVTKSTLVVRVGGEQIGPVSALLPERV